MILKWSLKISGLGAFIIGASSYFADVPWPINCKTIVCNIGTAIPLNVALMIVGFLLFIISYRLTKSGVKKK